MSTVYDTAVKYLKDIPEDRLSSAVDYLRFLAICDYPLDDYDYELAGRADEDNSTETISFEDACIELGVKV